MGNISGECSLKGNIMKIMLIILCTIGCILILFLINKRKKKKLGNPVIIANTLMSRKELSSLCIRSILTFIVAVILSYEGYIKNIYALAFILCIISAYSGYLMFSILVYLVFKNEIGIYENGVFTYEGIMEYSKMKKYVIDKSRFNNLKDITVYCKSTSPIINLVNHFNINEGLKEEANIYFKKKHRQIKSIKESKS
jgi:hypothetical protein